MPNPVVSACPPPAAACEPAANPGSGVVSADASFAKALQDQTAKAGPAENSDRAAAGASASNEVAPTASNPRMAASESPTAQTSTSPPAGAQATDAIAAILALLKPQGNAVAGAATVKPDNGVIDANAASDDSGGSWQKTADIIDMTATAASAAWAVVAPTAAPTATPAAANAMADTPDRARGGTAGLPANLAGGDQRQAIIAPTTHGAAASATTIADGMVESDSNNGFQAALTAAVGHDAAVPANLPSAALASAAASASAHATPAVAVPVEHSAPSLSVASPIGSTSWSSEVGDRLTWMIGHQEQRADLVLNPPHLGRIEVSLSINGDQANAIFASANPAVRDAISNAIAHLREQLAAFGVSLGQTQVGADSAGQSAQQQANDQWRGTAINPAESTTMATQGTTWLARGRGLVDTFA